MFFLNIYTIVEKRVRYSFLFTTKKKKTRPIGLHFILQFYKKKNTEFINEYFLRQTTFVCEPLIASISHHNRLKGRIYIYDMYTLTYFVINKFPGGVRTPWTSPQIGLDRLVFT